jgi:ribonuclease HI
MSPLAQQPTLDGLAPEQDALPSALVYTDGGCDPNPGPGGWAAVLQITPPEDELYEVALTGNAPHSTNNRMELEAAIAALAYLHGRYCGPVGLEEDQAKGRLAVELHTDSTYLRSGIREWIERWVANGWQKRNQTAVKNRDLWERLYALAAAPESPLDVAWHWVKGHAGDPLNERVDRLAGEARARLRGDEEPAPPPVSAAPPAQAEVEGPAVQLSVAAACPGARGPGAWAVVLSTDSSSGEHKEVLSGCEAESTNSALTLQGALAGLRALTRPARVTLYTTEEYLAKGASEWVVKWRQRGWTTSGNKPVQHRELWQALLAAAEPHHVTWQFVRKHDLTADLAEANRAAEDALYTA